MIEQTAQSAHRVLIVDDDVSLCDMVAEYLTERGFVVETEGDGQTGLERASGGGYALLVLDVRLPTLDGFEVLRRLRGGDAGTSRLPVIMLTAHGDEIDRIVGLELGADDYLPKPFNPRELLARIQAILRRAKPEDSTPHKAQDITAPKAEEAGPEPTTTLQCGDVEMEVNARMVRCGGEILELSAMEFDLLHTLLSAAGRVVSREELAREALGRRLLPFDRSLDIHICKLRHKLWPDDSGLKHIKTVRGIGYIMVKDELTK